VTAPSSDRCPHRWPTTIENNGIASTKIAVMAVPMKGAATERPTSWPATVVAPTATNGPGRPKTSRRRVATAMTVRTAAAVRARKVTAPTHPNASTTLRTSTNEEPQISASATYAATWWRFTDLLASERREGA
jgi:hypothetical protein